jgi:hypothetical protein
LKRDAYLTFVGRNRYLNDPGVLDEMKEFLFVAQYRLLVQTWKTAVGSAGRAFSWLR